MAANLLGEAGFDRPLGGAAQAMFTRACKDGLADVGDGALYLLLLEGLPTIES